MESRDILGLAAAVLIALLSQIVQPWSAPWWSGMIFSVLVAAITAADMKFGVTGLRNQIFQGSVVLVAAISFLLLAASFATWGFWPVRTFNTNKNHLFIAVEVRNSDYPDGITVAGLTWGHNLTDTRLHIRNLSDREYDNIDFLVQTDLVIVMIGQEPGISKCYFSAPAPRSMPKEIFGKDATGKDIAIPLERPPALQAISSIYRGQCDKLPPRSEIEVVLGVSAFRFGESNPLGNSRVSPAWIMVDLNYETNGSAQKESIKKCFVTNCPELNGRDIRLP